MTQKNKKILVTGGCGFIGGEVVRQLIDKGYRVIVADNLSKPGSSVKKGYEFRRVDLTDKKATLNVFRGVSICINLASNIGGIGYFHKYPATILSENNKIYSNTFEVAVANKIERMVYVSSSMVFESTKKFPSKEKDIFEISPPITAYGFSKLTGEKYCQAFRKEFGLHYTIIRPFNAYGINEAPGEEVGDAHVIPDLVKKILSGQYPLEILGDGQEIRCFTHVSDLARGIIMAMESKKAIDEDFNLSSQTETKIVDLAKKLWQLCGRKEKFKVKYVPGFKYDIKKRVPDVSKAKRVLGWKAEVDFDEGLREVIDWLRKTLKYD